MRWTLSINYPLNSEMYVVPFKSWRSFWHFQNEVARERRYVRTSDAQDFLSAVEATCSAREVVFSKGSQLWRARVAHEWYLADAEQDVEVPVPLNLTDMKPFKDRAYEGRVNPKGIPCLYMATTKLAAISEVRPWVGALVSLALLKTKRDLKIVNCIQFKKHTPIFLEEPTQEKIVEAIWFLIDSAFAEPVTPNDHSADYAATQTLAELFRSKGYDGVAYKSAFGEDGYNIALFNPDDAEVWKCKLVKVTDLTVKFDEEVEGEYTKYKQ